MSFIQTPGSQGSPFESLPQQSRDSGTASLILADLDKVEAALVGGQPLALDTQQVIPKAVLVADDAGKPLYFNFPANTTAA